MKVVHFPTYFKLLQIFAIDHISRIINEPRGERGVGWAFSVSVRLRWTREKRKRSLTHEYAQYVVYVCVWCVLHGRLGSQPCAHLSCNLAYRIRRKERGFGGGVPERLKNRNSTTTQLSDRFISSQTPRLALVEIVCQYRT